MNAPTNPELTPPPAINHVGDGDFARIGQTFLRYFIDVCALQPHEQVLDVGCGVGRIALPLAGYLNTVGGYKGLDVQAEAVLWCQQHITARHPNFHFCLADIYNPAYNPGGKYPASAYRLPYADASFDFVCLTSVFTHLLPPDMENYFAEIARVLKVALPVHYGSWHSRSLTAGGQDLVVATKMRSTPPRTGLTHVETEVGENPARKIRRRLREIAGVRRVVRRVIPANAITLVVSRGDERLVKLPGRRGWHFPQTEEGVYAGHHPANSAEAIAQLEVLRAKGAGYLVIPNPSLWWLDHYWEFRQHLETRFTRLKITGDSCAIYALCLSEQRATATP